MGKLKKGIRPTSGKVRKALFDIIRKYIKGACFLELYAGTGAIGIEAMRQGAESVVFVEANRLRVRDIQRSIQRYGLSDHTMVFNEKVLYFIQHAPARFRGFDIIFLDPPYHSDEVIKALVAIDKSEILKDDGVVIAEHFTKRGLPERFDRLKRINDYRYGDTMLSLYKKERQ